MRRTGIVADERRAFRQYRRGAKHAQPAGEIVRPRSPRGTEPLAQRSLARSADRQQHDVAELAEQRGADGRKPLGRPRRKRTAGAGRHADKDVIRSHAGIVQDAAADLAIRIGYGETETAQRVAVCARVDNPQQAEALVLGELRTGRWWPRWTARRVVAPRADDAPDDRRVNAQLPSRSRWRQREDLVESGRA